MLISKYFFRSQFELEEKITELKSELSMKDETIKKYISRLQCFYEKLKEHVKQTNQIISHSLITSDQDCNVSAFLLNCCIKSKVDKLYSRYRFLYNSVEAIMLYCT